MQQRPQLGELEPAGDERGALRRVGGQGGLGCGEGRRVGAAGQRREPADRERGALDDAGVGRREHGHEGAGLLQALVEAGHAPVHERGRLLAAQLGGGAVVSVHRLPGGEVALEAGLDLAPGGGGVGEVGGEEGGADAGAGVVAPDLGDPGGAAEAGRRPSCLAGQVDDEAGEGRREGADQHQAASAAALRREHGEQGVHARVALGGREGEAAREHPEHPARHLAVPGDRWEPTLADGGQQRGGRGADERQGAGQRLPQRDAEAELVAAGVDVEAEALLGRHVGRGPDDRALAGEVAGEVGVADDEARGARAREPARGGGAKLRGPVEVGGFARVGGAAQRGGFARVGGAGQRGGVGQVGGVGGRRAAFAGAGEAEVEDADAAVVADDHVVGLEVAVHEADGVGRREAAPGLHVDGEQLAPAARRRGLPGAQGRAGDELHGDEDLRAEGADVVDGDDVGVGEAGHRLGLAEEAGGAGAVGVLAAAQELDGDLAVELGVVGGVDDAHTAGAEAAEHDVAAERLAAGARGLVVLGAGAAEVGRGRAVGANVGVDGLLRARAIDARRGAVTGDVGHGRAV